MSENDDSYTIMFIWVFPGTIILWLYFNLIGYNYTMDSIVKKEHLGKTILLSILFYALIFVFAIL